jgi:chaperonin GroEL
MTHVPLIAGMPALTRLTRGFAALTALIAPTLGPDRGTVLLARGSRPEALDNSGLIARRITALGPRGEDAGAMLLRNLVWTMHERYGDGAATAAVLAMSLIHASVKRIAAGHDPMRMRRGVERAIAAASAALTQQAVPAQGQATLSRFATGITGDPELGALLGELFAMLGEHAALQIEEYAAPHLDRAYLDGGRWRAYPASRRLMPEAPAALTLHHPLIVVADQHLHTLDDVRPLLEYALDHSAKAPLLIIARKVSGVALDTLILNHTRGTLTIAVATMSSADGDIGDDLSDVALISSATLLSEHTGQAARFAKPQVFGRVRQAVLNHEYLTLVGASAETQVLHQRISELQSRSKMLDAQSSERTRLRMRMARLSGGVGILKIGAYTAQERAARKELAHKALRVLETTSSQGFVPGGGIAYLQCIPAVHAVRNDCANDDERAGVDALATALEAPFRQIVRNHGLLHPTVALAELRHHKGGFGYDARNGAYVCMAEVGVLDSLAVTAGALAAAASSATMLLTTDVVVMPSAKRRKVSVKP